MEIGISDGKACIFLCQDIFWVKIEIDMLSSVDVDRSGRFGIYSRKDVHIYNLKCWIGGDVESGFIKANKVKRLGLNKSSEVGSNLDLIFMDEYDSLGSKSSEFVKFGTHPRMFESFISVQGNSVLYGTLDGTGIDYISSQMMRISSFDWSPHFSTGTFVTSCEDALIRVSDIRSKSLDLSFMSFYNTVSIKWNPFNSYLLGSLHEDGEFLSIYDLRMLRPVGIIPSTEWLGGRRRGARTDRCIVDFLWLPLSSDKVLVCETDLLCVIDIPIVMGSSMTVYTGEVFDLSNSLIPRNGVQNISLKRTNVSLDFDVLSYSSSSMDEEERNGRLRSQVRVGETNQNLSCENGGYIEVNTCDFLSETNNLIINDKDGRFYYCEIKDQEDFGLRRLKVKYNGRVKRIFSSEGNKLTLFGGSSIDAHSGDFDDENGERGGEFGGSSFYVTSLPSLYTSGREVSGERGGKFPSLTLRSFCIDWFHRDLNMIHEKVKTNQQMANNLISATIESDGKIIAKLSRHPSLRGSFVMEDNTGSTLAIDSFEFTIILTNPQEKNNIKAVYYITHNTILLISEIYSNLIINNKLCGQEFEILPNYEYTSFNNLHARKKFCMKNIIPVRVYVDDIIIAKDRDKLNDLFGIEFDKELLCLDSAHATRHLLLDWVWVISSFPELVFGFNNEQNSELVSYTRRNVYGVGSSRDQQAIVAESRARSARVSFTFQTPDRLIISKGGSSLILFVRVNDEDGLNRASRYEDILYEINGTLRRIEHISEERFLYGDYFRYTYVLLNWLARVLYKQGRRRSAKDIQNFSIDPANVSEGSSSSMMLCPTIVHLYFKNRGSLGASRRQLYVHGDVCISNHPLRYGFNEFGSCLSVFDQIDKKKLITLLRKLYLEIGNNYKARILVVAIQKLSNHLERTEIRCQMRQLYRSGLGGQVKLVDRERFASRSIGSESESESRPMSESESRSFLGMWSIKLVDPLIVTCSVCLEPVFGLYTHCIACKHGGHMRHIGNWFEVIKVCAVSGCECKCVFEDNDMQAQNGKN